MRPSIQRDDANRVNHLVEQGHVLRRLEDLHVVVVSARQHRWAGVQAKQAPRCQADVLPRTGGAGRPRRAAGGGLLLRRRRERRHTPVCRHDDQRRAGPGRDLRPPNPTRSRCTRREVLLGREPLTFVLIARDPRLRGQLLDRTPPPRRSELLVGQVTWALEGGHRAVIPDPQEIGATPGGPGRRPAASRLWAVRSPVATRTIAPMAASTATDARLRSFIRFLYLLSSAPRRRWPYISSSTNSTHLNSRSCMFSSSRR